MLKHEKIKLIIDSGIIAIMRAKSSDQLIEATAAILDGGVKVVEVTMTTPGALELIEAAKKKFGNQILFGGGSVLDAETTRAVILAGADFVVSPTLNLSMITMCNRYSIPIIPGCYTPSEILLAWETGADMVKLFPANLGGPELIKSILAPLPQVLLVPVGGINLETTAKFIANGASAVGVGSDLVNQKLLDTANFSELKSRAASFINEVKKGRGEL